MMKNVTALLTAHNRREYTLQSLRGLFSQEGYGDAFNISAVLVDDGSTDGTSDAVSEMFPQVLISKGNGSLFWGGGMRQAFHSSSSFNTDFYLLLNDDTFLYPDAVRTALDTYLSKSTDNHPEHIVVGSTCDPQCKSLTYGGCIRVSNWHPFRYLHLTPQSNPQPCDTFNGNFVLIHSSVVNKIGFLDHRYTHQFGDTDYGLTAAKAGVNLWVTPGFIGECKENDPSTFAWDNAALPFLDRIKMFLNVKGMPLKESLIFSRKHGGYFWPLFFLLPIIRGIFFPTHYKIN
jgi:GT2 family glycosyltransferase